MPDPKNTKTKDTLYTWNGRQVNKQFSDSITFQKNYSDKMFNKGKKMYKNAKAFSKESNEGFDLMKRSVKLKPGPGTLKKKFPGGEQITTYNMKPYKMEPDPKKEALMSFRKKAVEQMKKYQDKKFEAEFASQAKMSEKKMYGGKQYTITSPDYSSLAGPYANKAKGKSFQMSPKGHGGQGYAMMGSKPKRNGKMVKIKGAGERRVVGGSGFIGYLGGGAAKLGMKALAKLTGHKAVKAGGKVYGYEKGGKMTNSFRGLFSGDGFVGQVAKHGFSKTIALRNAGIKSTKDLRYADKGWTPSAIKKNQRK